MSSAALHNSNVVSVEDEQPISRTYQYRKVIAFKLLTHFVIHSWLVDCCDIFTNYLFFVVRVLFL